MPILFIYTFKSLLSIIILGSIVIGAYQGCDAIGIPLNASVLDIGKMIEELLKGLPHIGDLVGFVFDAKSAIRSANAVQVSLLMEVVQGILLFMAFKLMYGIKRTVDKIFSPMLTYSGFLYSVAEYMEMMFLVLLSVMLSSVFKSAAVVLFSRIGINAGTALVMAVLVIGIFLSILIGKGTGLFAAIVSTAFDLVWGLVIVSLIYMVVLCTQILSMYSAHMPISEFIWVFSGEVLGLLALTIIGANALAKSGTSLFNIDRM